MRGWQHSETQKCIQIMDIYKTRTLGGAGPLVLAPAEVMGALWAPCLCIFGIFLSFLSFLSVCLFVFSPFCLFGFLSFSHHYHNHGVNIYYHTICCSNPTIFQFYYTLHHKPLPLLTLPPTTFSVPKRNPGKCFERPAKILRGRQRFGDNLGGGGAEGGGGAVVLTIWF